MHCWRNARDGRGVHLNPRLLAAFGGLGLLLAELARGDLFVNR